MVQTRLDTHPDAVCLSAIFTPRGWLDWRARAKRSPDDKIAGRMASLPAKWDDADRRIADIAEFHEAVMTLFSDRKQVGFKHHMGPVDRAVTARIIGMKLKSVILTRRNALAAFSSGLIAKATGQGALSAGQHKREAKVEFDALEFSYHVQWWDAVYAHWTAEVEKSSAPYMMIDYTEARTRVGIGRIASFLKLDPDKLDEFRTRKRNSDIMLDRFSNPKEARRYLSENGLDDWLVEK
ncbi:MAG: hypothetical protein ACTS1X_11315 [Parasphingopyxis sp.]